jgi:hypothetical protein
MESILADFDGALKKVSIQSGAKKEDWIKVCEKFNDDVSRVMEVTDQGDYTALFECCDDYNKKVYYLVEEDSGLYKLKHKRFLENLGLK